MDMLVEGALRAAALLALAGGVTLFLGRRPAAVRHGVWVLALVGAVGVPAAVAVLPTVEVQVPVGLTRLVEPLQSYATNVRRPDVTHVVRNTAPTRLAPSQARGSAAGEIASAVNPATHTGSRAPSPALSWSSMVLLGWLAGMMLLLLRSANAMRLARRLIENSDPLETPAWDDDLQHVYRELDIRRRVALAHSSEITIPMTLGWLKPAVLVPTKGLEWSAERRLIVLRHELAHIKRADFASELLGQLACAFHWFNPLAWFAVRRLRVEREHACDDLVLSLGTRASEYATHLVEIARSAGPLSAKASAGIAMAKRSQLESRVVAILNSHARRVGTRATGMVLAVVLVCVGLGVASVTPTAQTTGTQDDETGTRPRVETEVTIVETVNETAAAERGTQNPPLELKRQLELEVERKLLERRLKLEQVEVEERVELKVRLEEEERRVRERSLELERQLEEGDRRELERVLDEVKRHVLETRVELEDVLDEETRRVLEVELEDVRQRLETNREALLAQQTTVTQREQLERERLLRAVAVDRLQDAQRRIRREVEVVNRDRVRVDLDELRVRLDTFERTSNGFGVTFRQRDVVRALDSRVANVFIQALSDTDPEVREAAAEALGDHRVPAAVDALGDLLDDPEVDVASEAASALGQIGDDRAVAGLIGALESPEAELRQEAAEALGRIGSETAVDGLVDALTDDDHEVRQEAAWALGRIGSPAAVDGLQAALEEPDEEVQEEIIAALSRIEDPRATAALIAAVNQVSGDALEELVEALGRTGSEAALEALVRLMDVEDSEIRKAVIDALSRSSAVRNDSSPSPTPVVSVTVPRP